MSLLEMVGPSQELSTAWASWICRASSPHHDEQSISNLIASPAFSVTESGVEEEPLVNSTTG